MKLLSKFAFTLLTGFICAGYSSTITDSYGISYSQKLPSSQLAKKKEKNVVVNRTNTPFYNVVDVVKVMTNGIPSYKITNKTLTNIPTTETIQSFDGTIAITDKSVYTLGLTINSINTQTIHINNQNSLSIPIDKFVSQINGPMKNNWIKFYEFPKNLKAADGTNVTIGQAYTSDKFSFTCENPFPFTIIYSNNGKNYYGLKIVD